MRRTSTGCNVGINISERQISFGAGLRFSTCRSRSTWRHVTECLRARDHSFGLPLRALSIFRVLRSALRRFSGASGRREVHSMTRRTLIAPLVLVAAAAGFMGWSVTQATPASAQDGGAGGSKAIEFSAPAGDLPATRHINIDGYDGA